MCCACRFATVDGAEAVTVLRAAGFHLVALTPGGEPHGWDEVASTDRVALLVGAEGPGLSDEALGAADRRLRIPMAAGVDSLNVATAAAVAAYALTPRGPRAPTR